MLQRWVEWKGGLTGCESREAGAASPCSWSWSHRWGKKDSIWGKRQGRRWWSLRSEELSVHPGMVGMACDRMLKLERVERAQCDGGSKQGAEPRWQKPPKGGGGCGGNRRVVGYTQGDSQESRSRLLLSEKGSTTQRESQKWHCGADWSWSHHWGLSFLQRQTKTEMGGH